MASDSSTSIDEFLAAELLESDAAYFRAAAECEEMQEFRISFMPGLESLAAACVVHKTADSGADGTADALLALEQRISGLGFRHARFYQQSPDDELARQFFRHGYRPAEEIALINQFADLSPVAPGDAEVVLRPVRSDQDWAAKLALHREIALGPDGHVSTAKAWITMERRKCDVGYMDPFLIVQGAEVCGAVNFSGGPAIGRLKNIVIHPNWRRRGIGVQASRLVAQLAKERGQIAAGCFAMGDGQAVQMYRNAGYLPITKQVEWYRKLQ